MIFYGNGEIWNPINRMQIVFIEGEFVTKDEQHIEFLKNKNYSYKDEVYTEVCTEVCTEKQISKREVRGATLVV
jgi:hypothetical protein